MRNYADECSFIWEQRGRLVLRHKAAVSIWQRTLHIGVS